MKSKIMKLTYIVAKILEVSCAVVTLSYFTSFILALIFSEGTASFVAKMAAMNRGELSVQGFDIIVLANSVPVKSAVIAFTVAGILSFACRTMMFRNVYLILKIAAGKTRFSKGETPFQKDTNRMVFEIGICCIMIPLLQTLVNVVFRIATGGITESSVQIEEIVTGLIIIALSQIFTYGEKLETEVEGLV